MNENLHPEVKKYLSERNRQAVNVRWANTSEEEKKKFGEKLRAGRKYNKIKDVL